CRGRPCPIPSRRQAEAAWRLRAQPVAGAEQSSPSVTELDHAQLIVLAPSAACAIAIETPHDTALQSGANAPARTIHSIRPLPARKVADRLSIVSRPNPKYPRGRTM